MTWARENAGWLDRARQRWSPREAKPLLLRCWLDAPIAYDGYDPITIEGVLQSTVVTRETGRTPDDVFSDCPTDAPLDETDIQIPIVDVNFDGQPIAKASIGWFSEDARATKRQSWKRADAEHYNRRIVKLSQAENKTQMLLKATVTVSHVDFYVVGDDSLLRDLLVDVGHLGAARSGGLGELQGIEVRSAPADWSIVGPGKRLMRVLPANSPVSGYRDFDTRDATLRAPYWHVHTRRLCHVPIQQLGSPLMAATGRFFVKPHAVERYRERIPGKRRLSYEQALGEIIALSERAHRVRQDDDGTEIWRVGRPTRLRMRVAPGVGLPQITTILPAFDKGSHAGRR